MILRFCFIDKANNGTIGNILHKIIHTLSLEWSLSRKDRVVFLHIKGDEESLKSFSDTLSGQLPLSLFYALKDVTVVEDFSQNSSLPSCLAHIPFMQSTLKEVLDEGGENYYNPFLAVGFGDNLGIQAPLTLQTKDKKSETSREFKTLIQEAALHVSKGERLHVNTKEGVRTLCTVDENSLSFLKDASFTVLPTDFALVSKIFIAHEQQLKALASLEKPTLSLRLNLIYKNKNVLPSSWANVKLSDSLLLFLLTRELLSLGVEFVALAKDKEADLSLTHHQTSTHQPLLVNVLENGAVVPLSENEFLSSKKLPHFQEKAHGQYMRILHEHLLFEKPSFCFYLSQKHDDKAMLYTQKTGLVELVSITLPASMEELLHNISLADEGGERLIKNYEKEYGNLLHVAKKVPIPHDAPKNFYTLLGIVGVLFGFGESLESAAKTLLLHAKNFAGPKGPRIDVKMRNNTFPDTIDVVKFIRSGLSFRLASVENELLSYGYLESIAFFVSDLADIVSKEFETTHVALCGGLFEFQRLLETSAKNIQPNHKVCINRIYPIDLP